MSERESEGLTKIFRVLKFNGENKEITFHAFLKRDFP